MPPGTTPLEPIAMCKAGGKCFAMPIFGDAVFHALTWCALGAKAVYDVIVFTSPELVCARGKWFATMPGGLTLPLRAKVVFTFCPS